MTKTRRIALALAFALPLASGAHQALAFSYGDELPGLGSSNGFTDPDAPFDVLSDQMSQMYGTAPTDYSDLISSDDVAPGASQENAGPALAPRAPTNIGGTH
jgi:hypothetical protein